MESPARLFLIRHGEVEARYHRVFGGRIDMALSPFGLEQAVALADYLESIPFDSIYSSPMKRVQQTLSELVARQNRSPVVLAGLREVDFGVWTGLSWEEVKQQFNASAFDWLEHLEQGSIAGAESASSFRQRIEKALASILADAAGQTVAVVCHGGVIRMALSILLELPLRKMAAFDIEYASATIVDCLPGKVEIQLLNFAPWRDLK